MSVTVTSVNPPTGLTSGGTEVTIVGTNLFESTVQFGSNDATVTYIDTSGTYLSCISPAGNAGLVDVKVTNSFGIAILDNAFTYSGVPTITGFFPNSGGTLGGTTVSIIGVNLFDTSVLFGSNNATVTYTHPTGTYIDYNLPPGNVGLADIKVTNSFGVSILNNAFTYGVIPTITSISPQAWFTSGGTTVTIIGTNLFNTTVKFGSKNASNVLLDPYSNGTSLTCTLPSGNFGLVNVRVINSFGFSTLNNGFAYSGTPTITSVYPEIGLISGGENVTIIGTNLYYSTVKFGSNYATIVSIDTSGTSLTCTSPPGNAGLVDITVTTSIGNAILNNAFTYGLLPTITSISPIIGSTLGTTTVTIVGTDLLGSTVKFGSNDAIIISVNSDGSSITCNSPDGNAGLVNIQVTTPFGVTTKNNAFTYIPPPTISNIYPEIGSTLGGATVTIVGTNFSGSTVKFGLSDATIIFINSDGTSITCTSPIENPGLVDIKVNTLFGFTTKNNAFTYIPPPTITNIFPKFDSILGGTTVTIVGANLSDSTVKFNLTNATNVSVSPNGSSITCTSPPGNEGLVNLQVTTPFGSIIIDDAFTYIPPPTITSISPIVGVISGGTTVTIVGTDLSGSIVKFGSTYATNVSFNPISNSITCTSPAGNAGLVNLQIITPFGNATKKRAFTYFAPPTITNIYNISGVSSGGTNVTITGTNFVQSTIYFGLNIASNVSVNAACNVITCTSPPGTAGLVDIIVTTPFGSITRNNAFTYGSIPTITGISPATGSTLGSTMITINGSNLFNSTVKFGTNVVSLLSIDPSGSIITCYTPSTTTSETVNVEVLTPFGVTTLTNGFTYGISPTITSVSPAVGLLSGGTTVTIGGTNLSGSTVKFGSNNATNVYVNPSGSSITCTSPSGSGGLVNIEVTSPFGIAIRKNAFTYGAPPTISSISPITGKTTGGTSVKTSGTSFLGTIGVKFGTNNGTILSRNSAGTAFYCKTPASNVGLVDVEVTNSYGTGIKNNAFKYT